MEKISLTIFKDDCCGCHACEVACKQEHNLGVGPRFIRVMERSPSFTPLYCHHCADAPCKRACPVDAISRDGQGIVLINEETCIGCRECIGACPFGAMQFDGEKEKAAKCDLCRERVNQGESPACAKACPTRCIFWGDPGALMEKVVLERGCAG
jgi:Fe-S-cluster-containing dehydrogenase component